MATETNKRDPNFIPTVAGVTDDANLDPTVLRLDSTTKRLKTQTVIGTGTSTIGSVKITDGTEEASINASNYLEVSIAQDDVGVGGGTQYTEDDAAVANPVGSMLMGVRDDALSGQVTADGDNVAARFTNKGEVYVKHADDITIADGGNTITVDGTVTANAGTGTFNIQEASALDVSAATVTTTPAVTGGGTEVSAQRVTIANDSTGVLSVDDNGGSLTVDGTVTANLSATDNAVLDNIDTQTSAIQTAVETIDNAISGSEMQVDVVGSLPAGTNAIGKLAANSGVDIGDVDVTSISAGTNTIGAVVPSGHASAGTAITPYFDSDGDNTAQTMKGSAGRLYFLEVSNPNSSDAYIQLFDESGAITVGSTTPKLSLLIPAGDGTNDGAMDKSWTIGINFANSIKYACTTTATGNGDPTTGLVVNGGYV